MARITCKTPSTGKGILVSLVDVSTEFTTIAEAPDFSVPDPSNVFTNRDPLDTTRAVRPGEVFFITPLSARNKTANTYWIELRLIREDGTIISFGKISVPAYDTAFIPIQGRSLFKRDPDSIHGDRIQVKAEENSSFDVWTSAEEKLSNEHIGVI